MSNQQLPQDLRSKVARKPSFIDGGGRTATFVGVELATDEDTIVYLTVRDSISSKTSTDARLPTWLVGLGARWTCDRLLGVIPAAAMPSMAAIVVPCHSDEVGEITVQLCSRASRVTGIPTSEWPCRLGYETQ